MPGQLQSFEAAVLGQTILRARVQRVFVSGRVVRQENVIFLELAPRRWVRFFFDGGEFFWSWGRDEELLSSTKSQLTLEGVEPSWSSEVCGSRIEAVRLEATSFPMHLALELGGKSFVLHHLSEDEHFVLVIPASGRSA